MMMTLKAAFLENSRDADMSSSHWGTESDSGIERAWRQLLCDLQSIDRQAYRIFFEALNQSRS